MVRKFLLILVAAVSVATLLVGTRGGSPMQPPVARDEGALIDPVQVWHDVAAEMSRGAVASSDLADEVRTQPLGIGDAVRRMAPDEMALDGGRAILRRGRMRAQLGNVDFAFETRSIRVGEATVYEPGRGERLETLRFGDNLAVQRGGILEYYRGLGSELEQIFVLNAKPAAGDLVIEGRARTNQKLISATESRIEFGRGGETTLTIDRAVAVDAKGRSTAVAMNYDRKGDRLTMTVPAAWLEAAAYPVLVDPTIGTPFAAGGAISRIAANGVHSALGGRFLTVSGASGQFRSSADGAAIGSSFSVAGWSDLAFSAAAGRYLIAYCTYDGDGEDCVGVRTIDPTTGALSAESTMAADPDLADFDIDFWTACVAGVSSGWVVGWNVQTYDWTTDFEGWQTRAVSVNATGGFLAGPTTLRAVDYDYFGDDYDDWDWFDLTACAFQVSGGDRWMMTWGNDGARGGDWTTHTAVLAAVLDPGTMAVERDWVVESLTSDDVDVGDPRCAADDVNDQFLVIWDRSNPDWWYYVKGQRFSEDGGGVGGGDFNIKATTDTGPDYYNAGAVFSPLGSTYSAAVSCFFVAYNTGGNAYGTVINGGTSTVAATDIAIATTGAAESVSRMCLNPADTRTLIALSIGGVASIQMFEMKNVPVPVDITTPSLPSGTVNVAYSFTLTYTGGNGSPVWTMTGNPTWLQLNAATGELTGVPTGTGSIPLQITCTDGGADNVTLTLNINAAPGGGAPGGGGSGGGSGGGCSAGGSPGNLLPILAALLAIAMLRVKRTA